MTNIVSLYVVVDVIFSFKAYTERWLEQTADGRLDNVIWVEEVGIVVKSGRASIKYGTSTIRDSLMQEYVVHIAENSGPHSGEKRGHRTREIP